MKFVYPDLPMSDKDRYALSLAVKHRSWQEYRRREAELEALYQSVQAERKPVELKNEREAPPQATAAQLELFNLIPQSDYDYVEALLKRLPRARQQEYFRKLYLREYHSIKNDGSLAFKSGNKAIAHANRTLREVIEVRLGKVFDRYQFDLAWLSLSISEKWQWALEQAQLLPAQAEHFAVKPKISLADTLCKTHKKSDRLAKGKLPFYLIPLQKLKRYAQQVADIFASLQTDIFTEYAKKSNAMSDAEVDQVVIEVYQKCGVLCKEIGFPLAYWSAFEQTAKPKIKQLEVALNKVGCEKFWLRTFLKAQKQMVEHLAIACGEVRKEVSPYVSKQAFDDWRVQLKKNYDFLKAMVLQNIDDPAEQVELLEMFLRSSSNPSLRRLEMMTRLRGIEEWAEEQGHQALFLTLTAPSAFHAQQTRGGQNRKWSGASPKETQAYLNTVWKQFRALLAKRSIAFYGMRVAEPHHDATPHWHLLVYVHQSHVEEVESLFRQKALELDGDERGAKEHRCRVEKCDKSKGSATAYIAKYIAKNIDGFSDLDDRSDEIETLGFKDNAKRVRAWASLWGIRQFQFYGVSSISVWRELRRMLSGQTTDERLEELRICADLGDYAAYLQRQGGAGAKRSVQLGAIYYEACEPNRYGEVRKKVVGIFNRFKGALAWVKTRLKRWLITKPKVKPKANQASRSEAKNTGLCPAWTCVSNCNPVQNQQVTPSQTEYLDDFLTKQISQLKRLKQAMAWRGISSEKWPKHHLFSLLQGGSVQLFGQDFIRFDGVEVQIFRQPS